MTDEREEHWAVDHDQTKCALCTVCARNCPSEALRRVIEGGELTLYYNAERCDGCKGEPLCEHNCPEEAIKSVKAESGPEAAGYVKLFQSEMVQCQYCNEYFAPVRRLDVVSKKGLKQDDVNRVHCPLCRRTQLVIDFIETHRVPNSKAEYRSAKDIQRKARERKEHESK